MIVPAQAVRVVAATKPMDASKGHDGLAAIVEPSLGPTAFRADRRVLLEARRPDQGAALGR
jgi:hypothetical protein